MNSAATLESGNAAGGSAGAQYLTFLLAGEEYAVDILRVQEIRGWEKATVIPNTPAYVRGVINIRGTIVPIIDLRHRFELEQVPYGRTTVVIVVRVETGNKSRTLGLVVDAVSEVYNVTPDALKPAPDFGGGEQADFAKGLATVDQKMIIVLDIDRLLSGGELVLDTPAQN